MVQLKQTRQETSVLATPLELLWSHHGAQHLGFGCSLMCPSPPHFQQKPKNQEEGEGGWNGNTHGAHVNEIWLWVCNFCFLWITLFEHPSPLAINLCVYIIWVLLHTTSQIYLNRSWSQSAPHEEAGVDTPVEIISRCSSTVFTGSTGRALGSYLKVSWWNQPSAKPWCSLGSGGVYLSCRNQLYLDSLITHLDIGPVISNTEHHLTGTAKRHVGGRFRSPCSLMGRGFTWTLQNIHREVTGNQVGAEQGSLLGGLPFRQWMISPPFVQDK